MKEIISYLRFKEQKNRLSLVVYDLIVFIIADLLLFVVYTGAGNMTPLIIVYESILALACIFSVRDVMDIYRQVWRYGGIQCYIRLLISDTISFFIYFTIDRISQVTTIAFAKLLAFTCVNTLGALAIRMFYRYAYKCGSRDTKLGAFLRWCLKVFALGRVTTEADPDSQKIKIAILGAGSVGVSLAENLINNPKTTYIPRCFIDIDDLKIGRTIHDISVVKEDEKTLEELKKHHIQEVVFAVPNMGSERKVELYDMYRKAGFKIKVFDYPAMNVLGKKRQLREFDIEDLLFRQEKEVLDDNTVNYYKDKVILITGGGGSIGSELCRQVAKMKPKQLIVLDIYENCAYNIQQEIKFTYYKEIDIKVEIVSITNKKGMARVFKEYRPNIVINAAAHKHVPLMEKNCIEAVENNVFGTLNVIQLCEEYGAERFMMVSTDKAVNPTNVMGATKRMCEFIMLAYSSRGKVKCSATRFGNVLGSAGSVIPIFRRQIAAGGPVTLTDKRIIRYFMTIPEASQLVLTSGAMAKNGELFVLDMGKPVKIYDLAVNMIELSGAQGIDIIETGLRPGEKLYEELLVKKEELDKTDNNLIYIEKAEVLSMEELEGKLTILREACEDGDDEGVRNALKVVVPSFKSPEEVNKKAEEKIKAETAVQAV